MGLMDSIGFGLLGGKVKDALADREVKPQPIEEPDYIAFHKRQFKVG